VRGPTSLLLGGLIVVMLATVPTARVNAASSARVACWDITGKHLSGYKVRPGACGLRRVNARFWPRLIGVTWSSFGGSVARGKGASYREWADARVRLDRPRMQCGHRVYTRAFIRYVGYGGGDKTFFYRLKSC